VDGIEEFGNKKNLDENHRRVEQHMSDHLSAQGRLDPRGGLCCFWCRKQNSNPSYWYIWCTKNCQKWLRIEKVTALQSRGFDNSKKTNHQTLQNRILEHSKNSLYVALLLLEF
jgi:hypothetical protein